MISMDIFQQFMESAAKLADSVEKHLSDIPSETEMTIALNELRMAQLAFDKDLMEILEALEKEQLTYEIKPDTIKTRH